MNTITYSYVEFINVHLICILHNKIIFMIIYIIAFQSVYTFVQSYYHRLKDFGIIFRHMYE